MSLIWDFYREIGHVDGTGAVVHYYDEYSQSIYLSNGIKTKTADVRYGSWENAPLSNEISVVDTEYDLLSVDHPSNGILHCVAIKGNELYYLRYIYAMDISDIIQTGSWRAQVDNAVTQMSISIKNISSAMFAADNTLFNPGAKITLSFRLGDSSPYTIGTAYLDEIDYDRTSPTVNVSGRNTIGYFLKDQTFDLNNSFTGYSHEIAADILELSGMDRYIVGEGTGQMPFTFNYNKTILDGLNDMMSVYTGWKMIELPDGTIVIGYDNFIQRWQTAGIYSFHGEKEVFKRKTTKNADAAYTRVLVTGDDGISPVLEEINNFAYWALGAHKTAHIKAPAGMTADELAEYAKAIAAKLQFVGMGEDFSSPLRPQLLVGDVAEVYYDDMQQSTSLGIITEVKHTFGVSGFYTDFSIDSGGIVTDGDSYSIISRSAALGGYNRKQRVTDFIKVVSDNTFIKK